MTRNVGIRTAPMMALARSARRSFFNVRWRWVAFWTVMFLVWWCLPTWTEQLSENCVTSLIGDGQWEVGNWECEVDGMRGM
jgi:hypothetical protein